MDLEVQKAILQTIDIMIAERLKSLTYNYYKEGQITAISLPYYTVKIDGEIYNIKARTGLTLNINDIVYVLIINGNFSNKIIDLKRI